MDSGLHSMPCHRPAGGCWWRRCTTLSSLHSCLPTLRPRRSPPQSGSTGFRPSRPGLGKGTHDCPDLLDTPGPRDPPPIHTLGFDVLAHTTQGHNGSPQQLAALCSRGSRNLLLRWHIDLFSVTAAGDSPSTSRDLQPRSALLVDRHSMPQCALVVAVGNISSAHQCRSSPPRAIRGQRVSPPREQRVVDDVLWIEHVLRTRVPWTVPAFALVRDAHVVHEPRFGCNCRSVTVPHPPHLMPCKRPVQWSSSTCT
jgi:hypothetical protein